MTDELDSLKDYASALEEERCRVEGSVQDARTTLGDLERKGEETQGEANSPAIEVARGCKGRWAP